MSNKFENKRMQLLNSFGVDRIEKQQKNFFELIELVIFDMLKTEYFFGKIVVQMGRKTQFEKKEKLTIEINIDEFDLVFNPLIFLQLNFEEMKAAIIHEILHLFFQHPAEQQKLKNRFSKSALNQALDKDLEDKKNGKGDNDLKELAQSFEKSQESSSEQEEYQDFHSGWSKNGEFDHRILNKAFHKIIENVLEKNRELMPAYLEEYFIKLLSGKAELKWQQILKKELGKLPVPYKKTITRKDRRQPERLDVKGRLPKYLCKIFVAIDTSGSMGEEELEYAFNEIFGIIKHYDYRLTVIECDAAVEKVYQVKRKRDIQFKVRGRGGTAFQPVFDYLEKRRERDYLLVYFTDGYGESSLKGKPKGGRVMWVITGDSADKLSLIKPYGAVRELQYKKGRR